MKHITRRAMLGGLAVWPFAAARWARGQTRAVARAATVPTTAPATLPAGTSGRGRIGGGAAAAGVEPGCHDPCMIRQGDWYYVYNTGGGINALRSSDLIHWSRLPGVFGQLPAWIGQELPGVRALWAPDISHFNGTYHLYYAASVFGKNTSRIGLATNATLDPLAVDYKWQDRGMVLASQGVDNFNAIDPNLSVDAAGVPWLTFGSFWTGIKQRRLKADTGLLDPADAKLYSLAERPGLRSDAIEAPFVIHRGDYYYLFVSFDLCCKGVQSTYRIMVGRSGDIHGPYADRDGKPMLQGGGGQLLAGDGGRLIGPGGCSVVQDGERWLLVYHFYDGNDAGRSKLQIRPLTWDNAQWPAIEKPLGA